MEPDSLARGFYTEKDDVIKQKDEPERFQLRSIPVRYHILLRIFRVFFLFYEFLYLVLYLYK